MGFTLSYGAMFSKVWRVHRFTTKQKQDPKVCMYSFMCILGQDSSVADDKQSLLYVRPRTQPHALMKSRVQSTCNKWCIASEYTILMTFIVFTKAAAKKASHRSLLLFFSGYCNLRSVCTCVCCARSFQRFPFRMLLQKLKFYRGIKNQFEFADNFYLPRSRSTFFFLFLFRRQWKQIKINKSAE